MEKMSGKCCVYVGRWLCSIALVMSMVACDDALDNKTPDVPSEKGVPVELSFGFANEEDGYTLSGSGNTRSENALQEGGFSAQLIPNVDTRATADLKPDALYELHVLQYKQNGTLIKMNYKDGATVTGAKLTYNLDQADDCQLVIVARGKGNAFPVIDSHLADVQKLTMDKTIFENIPTSGATQDQINKMPYVLHLEHVNVTSDGKLQSIEGAHDARLLLKRLATKLTVKWNINSSMSSYTLKEVKLCQAPSTFRIIPSKTTTEWGTTYPSEVSEFIEFYRLTDNSDLSANTKTVWIPANVRGTSARATSPYYRTKDNAPTAASYMELVLDNSGRKERLYYRAYLGGVESTDFNLYENCDYNWTLTINSANYQTDRRIQLLDQSPVESSNLVPTSNCFMMVPGTNICFNPYKHTAKMNGFNQALNGWNTHLTDGSTLAADKKITNVKVYWQTKDNATSGELVVGYVISNDDHSNLVRITGSDNLEQARIHVKVPVTKGGNALIAAYSGDKVVWSWHLWITDYVPLGISPTVDYNKAQELTKSGSVHQYAKAEAFLAGGAHVNKVIMDRHLCATAGGFPGKDASLLEFSKRMGYLYYWGRKDPIFGSVDGTSNEVNVIYDGNGVGLALNKIAYGNNNMVQNGNTLQFIVENPLDIVTGMNWYNADEKSSAYQYLYNDTKTLYDPCPDGWKTPHRTVYSQWSTSSGYWFDTDGTFKVSGSFHPLGGRLYNISGDNGVPSPQSIHNTAWYPITGYRVSIDGSLYIADAGYAGTNTMATQTNNYYRCFYIKLSFSELGKPVNQFGYLGEPYPFRCVQE